MEKLKNINSRRSFIKKCGLSATPFLVPPLGLGQGLLMDESKKGNKSLVNFVYDGLAFSPQEYIQKLTAINKVNPIEPDFYGNGGATKALETAFAKITGKEKAIYLPSGTMANQIAIKLLNGENTKVVVPENSHVFRDEADAAQSVHNKRLIPVGLDQPFFAVDDLEKTINYLNRNEVFKSGLGTVVLENPIRRADGAAIPIEVIKSISSYCKTNGYKLHLDGARIHIASAFTNVSVEEYASYFDTVYISLYKYLNTAGGAVLCGEASLIDQVAHQIKIYGGTVFQSWMNSSMALHYLDGIEKRWAKVVRASDQLMKVLNKMDGVSFSKIQNGTNIFDLKLDEKISLKKLAGFLYKEHSILVGRANENGIVKFTVNESLLTREVGAIVAAWEKGLEVAK